MNALRSLVPVLASLAASAAAVAVPTGAADAVPAASASPGSATHVTWNGWNGVHFGDSIRAAHQSLGGTYTRGTNDVGGCGDALDLRTGTIDAKVGPHAHRASDFDVAPSVSYPAGVRSSMRLPKITRTLERAGFTVRTHEVGRGTPMADNESYVAGPHGHTLYVLSDIDSGSVYRMGLALNHRVAKQLMEINGC